VAKTLRLAGWRRSRPRYGHPMPREISCDELHDRTDEVLAAVRAGERLALTVDGEPIADIVPHPAHRSSWVPATELGRIRREAPADPRLLGDLADVRGDEAGRARCRSARPTLAPPGSGAGAP
jgi:antitoxin (DNA-binding transcriptional repressor) of toxin-antitoxin stability system